MANVLFVDTETSGLIRDDGTIPDLHCAVVTSGTGKKTHYRGDPIMTETDVNRLAAQLCGAQTVYTFNGASFDLRVIAAHASEALSEQIAMLTLSDRHIDVLLDFASRAGYLAGLSSFFSTDHAAPKSMSGADAAAKWLIPSEREAVLEYCENDTLLLRSIVRCVCEYGRYERTSRAGRAMTVVVQNFQMRDPLEAYEAHTKLDLSWMTDPPDLSDGFEWALEAHTTIGAQASGPGVLS